MESQTTTREAISRDNLLEGFNGVIVHEGKEKELLGRVDFGILRNEVVHLVVIVIYHTPLLCSLEFSQLVGR